MTEGPYDLSLVEGSVTTAEDRLSGLLYHRYRLNAKGDILEAKIVPPTSQNQRQIEVDLQSFLGNRLQDTEDDIASFCGEAIRNYDPCISCATHFLNVKVERGVDVQL